MRLRGKEKVTINFWRICDEHKVWYEWCITEPYPKRIHNSEGKHYTIGL